jgi:hypothetical protein
MTKRTIVNLWIWGEAALILGAILIPSSLVAFLAHISSLQAAGRAYDFTADGYSQTMVALAALGFLLAVTGLVMQFIAWIGAVTSTRRLADRTWFKLLLWIGILGLVTTPLGVGVFVSLGLMLAYMVGGPDALGDGAVAAGPSALLLKPTIARWTIWGWVALAAGVLFALLVSNLTNPWGFLHGHVWPALALIMLGTCVSGVGFIALSAAYWGEVFNAHRLEDQTWFKTLLWGAVVSTVTMPLFGLGAIIAAVLGIVYLVAGPDGMAVRAAPARTITPLPPWGAPTSGA